VLAEFAAGLDGVAKMSPVDTCGMPYFAESSVDWVPLPAPCFPRTIRFSRTSWLSLQEAFVVTHHELTVDLAHVSNATPTAISNVVP